MTRARAHQLWKAHPQYREPELAVMPDNRASVLPPSDGDLVQPAVTRLMCSRRSPTRLVEVMREASAMLEPPRLDQAVTPRSTAPDRHRMSEIRNWNQEYRVQLLVQLKNRRRRKLL